MKCVSFPWPPVAAHDSKSLFRTLHSSGICWLQRNCPCTQDSFTSVDPNIPFHLCRRRRPIKIAFALTINKAQRADAEACCNIYLPSLSFFLVSWSASFDNVALEIIEVHRQCLENDTFVTSLYIEKCFKVSGI